MILAEQQQPQLQSNVEDSKSIRDDENIKIDIELVENKKIVPKVRVEEAVVHYENSEEDESNASSLTSSLSSNDDDDDDDDNDKCRVPVQREVNGIPLGDSQAFGDLKIVKSTNVRLKAESSFWGPVTIKQFYSIAKPENVQGQITGPEVDKKVNGNTDDNEVVNIEKNNGYTHGPKLSNGSAHPLYPFPSGSGNEISGLPVSDWCWTKRYVIASVAATILVAIIVLIVWLTFGSGTTKLQYVPASPNDTSINNDPTIPGVHIVPRVSWGAQPPKSPPDPLRILPPSHVIISHTASGFCYTQAQCVLNVRVAQTFHIESLGWDDIGYNFLVGGDGLVYEGRGWDVEGAHTFNYNYKSIGLSFIGTFNSVEPTKAQVYAAKKLIEYGVENGKIAKDYKLLGHRQCIKTESPGEVLYNIIKTWDHWSPTP